MRRWVFRPRSGTALANSTRCATHAQPEKILLKSPCPNTIRYSEIKEKADNGGGSDFANRVAGAGNAVDPKGIDGLRRFPKVLQEAVRAENGLRA